MKMLSKYYKIEKDHEFFDGVIGRDIPLKLSQRIKILFSKGISILLYGTGAKCDMTILYNENKRLKKALDNAIKECCIGVAGSDACSSLDELYKAFEKKVWEDVK